MINFQDKPAKDTAVLVVSCDKYWDVWKPFFTLFFKYWPGCQYPLYLGSNWRWYVDERVRPLLIGSDVDWSSNLCKILERLQEYQYIVLLQEDFFIYGEVDSTRIDKLIALMRETKAACLRLFPSPGPGGASLPTEDVGEIGAGEDYRVSLQAALWDREVLLSLLVDGETPWQFEVRGSRRADAIPQPFLSVARKESSQYPIQYLCTAVVRGRWLPEAVSLCQREGIVLDVSRRPLASRWFWVKDGARSMAARLVGERWRWLYN